MPIDKINGINLYWELTGQKGDSFVLVHGSWVDHHSWDAVVNELSKTFKVVTYDRRGHSKSERPDEQGSIEQDVSDLIALVEHLGLVPAHIVGNSGGASIVLRTATKRQDIFKTLVVHEPPLFGLLKDAPGGESVLKAVINGGKAVANLIAKGENEEAAKQFVENIAIGPGAWRQFPVQVQQTFIYNAPTFYDETQDPEGLNIDTSKLSHFNKPALLTNGTQSPSFFLMALDELAKAIPHAKRVTYEGAGHIPHMSHPTEYIEVVKNFCLTNA